jgi:ubiquitin carboxyl-terminal hydrolase 7
MLQSLFCTPAFSRLVFEIPTTEAEAVDKCIPLCLQRLFACMQPGERSSSTAALTKSFGWDDLDTIIQHDVHEFCRVLLVNLQNKMKKTPLEGRIAGLLRRRFRSFIRCLDVTYIRSASRNYATCRCLRGCPTLQRSFETYIETAILDGDNIYQTPNDGN